MISGLTQTYLESEFLPIMYPLAQVVHSVGFPPVQVPQVKSHSVHLPDLESLKVAPLHSGIHYLVS